MEEMNEVMTNEEIIETTEEVAENFGNKGLLIAAGVCTVLLVGGIVYRYVVPGVAKIRDNWKKDTNQTAVIIEPVEDGIIEDKDTDK